MRCQRQQHWIGDFVTVTRTFIWNCGLHVVGTTSPLLLSFSACTEQDKHLLQVGRSSVVFDKKMMMMKSVTSFLCIGLFLPKGYSVSAFPTLVPLTQQNKILSPATSNDLLDIGTAQHRAQKNSNTQLQAWPATAAAAVSALRGGAASSAVLNLSREGYYLQSLATYGTVTALIMNAALRLYSSTKFPIKQQEDKKRVKYMNSVFTGVTALCIISGAFTAVLFNILGIYTKSSLGMSNDEGYIAFRAAVHVYTKWGFRSFLTTCMSFVGSFLLSLYARIKTEDDKPGQIVLGASILLALVAVYHIRNVLALATKFIFTPEFLAKVASPGELS